MVLILGTSGSGKPSLMRAGVLPRLERDRQRSISLEPFESQGVLGAPLRLHGSPGPRNGARRGRAANKFRRR